MWTPAFGVRRVSSTSGVSPTRSSSDGWSLAATGHRGQQDHGLPLADGRVEPVERANVLALDVDVHERRDLPVPLEDLLSEPGEARRQVLEHRAHGLALRGNLPLAADLRAERGGNPHDCHAC